MWQRYWECPVCMHTASANSRIFPPCVSGNESSYPRIVLSGGWRSGQRTVKFVGNEQAKPILCECRSLGKNVAIYYISRLLFLELVCGQVRKLLSLNSGNFPSVLYFKEYRKKVLAGTSADGLDKGAAPILRHKGRQAEADVQPLFYRHTASHNRVCKYCIRSLQRSARGGSIF